MDYLYDETFEGFLCCVYHHYYSEKASGIYPSSRYQGSLLDGCSAVAPDGDQAERVYRAIEGKMSVHDAKRIYLAFCSSVPGKEMKLLRYIRLGFKIGPRIRLLHGNPAVFDVQKAEQKAANEVHRMLGLVRFSEVYAGDGGRSVLYSAIEPDNDILEFLAEHFCDRLKNDPFLIHDKRRGKALACASGEWYITDFQIKPPLRETEGEAAYRRLWMDYFDTIAIKERANPACQRRFMPLRYWKNLTEIHSGGTYRDV